MNAASADHNVHISANERHSGAVIARGSHAPTNAFIIQHMSSQTNSIQAQLLVVF